MRKYRLQQQMTIGTLSRTYRASCLNRGLDLGGQLVRPLTARAKDPGFGSPISQHVQRLISRAFTYGAVDSLDLGPATWVHFIPVLLD